MPFGGMKSQLAFELASTNGHDRASIFSTSFTAPALKRHDNPRGPLRYKQRSSAASFSVHGSNLDSTDGGSLEHTQPSMQLIDEEYRQQAERQARRVRQLQAREARQRSVLFDEATQELDEILARHAAYMRIAATCAAMHAQREAATAHTAAMAQRWSSQLLDDAVVSLLDEEVASRRGVTHAEAAVRETVVRLEETAARGLSLHESLFRLVQAEQTRRAFLLREEARGVEALRIPGFISLPCAATVASLDSQKRARPAGASPGMHEVEKIDLMAEERCPFRCAADCPYMPARTRQLGAAWAGKRSAAESGKKAGGCGAHAASGSPIDEVGRQRVRAAMAKDHLRDTSTFLPSLRI